MKYYPNHICIETVAGLCSSRCIMCSIEEYPLKGIMNNEDYEAILDKFVPYKEKIKFITLVGMGEPLLDKGIVAKVKMTMDKGFVNIGFPTNGMALTGELSKDLIDNGLATIIFSIDGINKETHEAIRRGTNFDVIMDNVCRFIDLRNRYGKTKIIVRMIRQNLNENQAEEFENYWRQKLDAQYGDQVAIFDVHNNAKDAGDIALKENLQRISRETKRICEYLLDRFFIQLDGNVLVCCIRTYATNLGNIYQSDPIEIYNNDIFTHYRNKMSQGKMTELNLCKNCGLYISQSGSLYKNV